MIGWLWRKLARTRPGSGYPNVEMPYDNESGIAPEEVFCDAAARFLDIQISTNDVFDNRTSNAFSIGCTVLPVTFGLLRLSSATIPVVTIALLATALAMYVVLVFCVWRSSRIRVLAYRPNMEALEANSRTVSGETLQRWVATEYVASTRLNGPMLNRKGVWVGRAVTAPYAEGFLLSVAAISTLL